MTDNFSTADLLREAQEAFGAKPASNNSDADTGTLGRTKYDTPLTGHDRCDTRDCGAQAFVRVIYSTGDLLFCGHHFNEIEKTDGIDGPNVKARPQYVHDERSKIGESRLDVSA